MESVRPDYRIPTLEEIRAIEPNGRLVVSTFSGAGGSCLGFRMAGFRIAYANEFVQAARETYRANADPATVLDDRDIRTVSGASIRELAGIGDAEIDVLEGSPPCASFSTAGKRQAHWGKAKAYSDTVQRVDDLFDEYVRLVRELRPRSFVAENVSGLVKGVAKGYAIEILAALRASGYRVASRLLDAQWLGVPQARVRLIIVGIRDDLPGDPADVFPKPLPYRYSVRDALPEIDAIERPAGFQGHGYETSDKPSVAVLAGRPVRVRTKRGERSLDEPSPAILTHGRRGTESELTVSAPAKLIVEPGAVLAPSGSQEPGSGYALRERSLDRPAPTIQTEPGSGYATLRIREPSVRLVERMPKSYVPESDQEAPALHGYAILSEWDRLMPGEASERYLNLVRPAPGEPVPTITATGGGSTAMPGGYASVTHPFEPRKFTIDELRRLSGFPADFVLTGTYAQQWERIGRAVPPPMMAAVARGLRRVLEAMGG